MAGLLRLVQVSSVRFRYVVVWLGYRRIGKASFGGAGCVEARRGRLVKERSVLVS